MSEINTFQSQKKFSPVEPDSRVLTGVCIKTYKITKGIMHRKHVRKPKHASQNASQLLKPNSLKLFNISLFVQVRIWWTFFLCPRIVFLSDFSFPNSDWSSFETKNVLETEIYGKEFHGTCFCALIRLRSALSKTALFR